MISHYGCHFGSNIQLVHSLGILLHWFKIRKAGSIVKYVLAFERHQRVTKCLELGVYLLLRFEEGEAVAVNINDRVD